MATQAENYRVRIGAWVKARLMRNPDAVKVDCEGLDLFVVRNVLSPQDCADVMALIDTDLIPSQLMSPTPDREFRTSETCNLHPQLPLVARVDAKIRAVVGIQDELGEAVQGQRYSVGQQFKPHYDFFFPTEPYWADVESTGGQRTWTAMAFLSEPDAGGHTIFTEADVSLRPRAGNLVVWNNLTPEGDLNLKSMHTGSPVAGGRKYVLTKWYRERPWSPLPANVQLY